MTQSSIVKLQGFAAESIVTKAVRIAKVLFSENYNPPYCTGVHTWPLDMSKSRMSCLHLPLKFVEARVRGF